MKESSRTQCGTQCGRMHHVFPQQSGGSTPTASFALRIQPGAQYYHINHFTGGLDFEREAGKTLGLGTLELECGQRSIGFEL